MLSAETRAQVRYGETDQMGVVYHANYLVWLELGRTALLESLGLNYSAMEEEGAVSPVVEVQIRYRKPLRYGDTAVIRTWLEDYDGVRIIHGYKIMNQHGDLCATASTTNIWVDRDSFRPLAVKRSHPRWHQIYEQAKQK